VTAQTWTAETVGTEADFHATAGTPDFGLFCGQGEGDFATRSGELVMRIAAAPTDATDLAVTLDIDGATFDLPSPEVDPGGVTLRQPLDINDPVWSALRAGDALRVSVSGLPDIPVPLTGSSAAIAEAARFCATRWTDPATPDLPRTVSATPQPSAPTNAVIGAQPEDAARQFLLVDCAAGARLAEGALQSADFDGDGNPDQVLDAAAYTCGDTRPYCGAVLCSVFVFLSSRPLEPPVDLFGLAPQVTRAGGRTALQLGTALSSCTDPRAPETCTGQTLVFDGEVFVPAAPETGPPRGR
jgi:hypothetical protein